jgi:hypothetical protein
METVMRWLAIFVLIPLCCFPYLACCADEFRNERPLARWSFDTGAEGWLSGNQCSVEAAGGELRVTVTGAEPYFYGPQVNVPGPLAIRIRAKCATAGQGRVYWTSLLPTMQTTPWGENAVQYFDLFHDGQWHEYTVPLEVEGQLAQVRLDPGSGAGHMELDSVELVDPTALLSSDAAAARAHLPASLSIAVGSLQVALDPQAHRYTIADRVTGRVWNSLPVPGIAVLDAKLTGSATLALNLIDLQSQLRFHCVAEVRSNGIVAFTLTGADGDTQPLSRLRYPPAFQSNYEQGHLVFCNRSCGVLLSQTDESFPAKSLFCYSNLGLDMPWMGAVDLARGDGCLVILETAADVGIDMRAAADRRQWPQTVWPQTVWHGTRGRWGYTRRVSYQFVSQGGYVGVAKAFRSYAQANGLFRTLKEKAAERPKVAWLKGGALMWGTGGLKFAREAKAAGIRHGIVYGKYPLEDLEAITALGFLTAEYDSYTDFLEGERGFQKDKRDAAYHTPAGLPVLGWRTLEGLQYLSRSSAFALDTARLIMPTKLQKFPFTGRFLDVSACVDLFEDYHPDHTFGRAQDMSYRKELYRYFQKDLGLVVGGEHGKAWIVTDLDYTEGMLSGPFWWEMPAGYLVPPKSKDDLKENYLKWGDRPDHRIPLWDLVYHDCIATTWYWGDCNGYYNTIAPEMSDRKDLFTMLHGQLPLLWTTDVKPGEPLDYGWSRHRARFLETCRHAGLLNEQVGFEEMLTHEFLSDDRMVQRTRFAGGGWCVVNFSQEARRYTADGVNVNLAPNGFIAKAGPVAQSRLVEDGQVVTRVDAPGYHSLQTPDRRVSGPISTRGRLTVFEREPGRWHVLAECTEESSVDMCALAGTNFTKSRLIALNDDGSERETLSTSEGANGRVQIPGCDELRLFGVVAIP